MAVPRPRKSAVFDADDQTIVEHFDRAMRLKATQRGVSSEITALNAQMSEAGVDPGTLTICCKLARMPRGKRGVAVALLHRYLQVLARQLDDPTVPVELDGPTVPVEHAARPNGGLTPEPFAGREGVGAPSPHSSDKSERVQCQYCEDLFIKSQPGRKFCSPSCKRAWREDRKPYTPSGNDSGFVAALHASGGSFQ
jgi:hypothetical protein